MKVAAQYNSRRYNKIKHLKVISYVNTNYDEMILILSRARG